MKKFFLLAVLVLLGASGAHADMVLTYGSNDADILRNASPYPAGSFEVQVQFDQNSPVFIAPGEYSYPVTSINVLINSTSYVGDVTGLASSLILSDSSNTTNPGDFSPIYGDPTGSGPSFIPLFSGTTTSGWSSASPTPTVFTGYLSSVQNRMIIDTNGGEFDMTYNRIKGVDASIDYVAPMPSALSMCCVWGVVCIGGMLVMRPKQSSLQSQALA